MSGLDRTPCQILEVVIATIPYPNLISDIDVVTEPDAVRFTWRRTRFRVGSRLRVEEVIQYGGFLGSNVAILLEEILKKG